MKRKLLFLVFTDDACRRNHAFMYAVDLRAKGHDVKLVIEGAATQSFRALAEGGTFARLFEQAKRDGLIAGACLTASNGCACGDETRKVADIAREQGVQLLNDMQGHAGIEPFVREGYEIVVF